MKKVIVFGFVACAAIFAQANVQWSWWLENPSAKADLSFGIASKCQEVETFELSLLYSASPVKGAVQWAFWGINNSDADCALQLALANIGRDPIVQLGFLNINKSSAFDWGFLNISDAAKFQLGLLNFDKKGFLPFFPFVNLDPSIFD